MTKIRFVSVFNEAIHALVCAEGPERTYGAAHESSRGCLTGV